MKVWGIPNGPQGRGKKINGAFITVRRKDGSVVIRSWPRKRGYYQSERQRQWGEWFAAVSRWATSPDPGSQAYALEVTSGTIFMPRDVLLKIARGNLWYAQMKDGTVLWNVWQMAEQIQVELDTISDVPGSLLYRAPGGWVALAPGKTGDVLTSNPDQGNVFWGSGGGGGQAAIWAAPNVTSRNNGSTATKGAQFIPAIPCKLHAICFPQQSNRTGTYTFSVWRGAHGKLVDKIYQGGEFSSPQGDDPMVVINLSSPLSLTPQIDHQICLTQTDGGNTANCNVYGGGSVPTSGVWGGAWQAISLASTDPQPNTTVSMSASILAIAPQIEW